MCRKKIAIIAAMEREVRPLIRHWKVRMIEQDGRRYRLFENGEAAVVCGGIGAEAARRATEAVIREVHPVRVLSVGFAGALGGVLAHSLQVGDILEPRTVINAADGVRTEVGSGDGILVSSATVAGKEQKTRFARAYGAIAVDMEAAAVAQGAQARGVEFGVLKAISDDADFDLPALDRFVAHDGSFHSASFACHMALRPWLWRTTMVLARNSSKASRALCAAIGSYLGRDPLQDTARRDTDGFQAPFQALTTGSLASDWNQNGQSPTEDAPYAGVHTRGTQPHTRATEKG
jgi:adenosylhomocysteine nucleosidase